MAKGGNEPDVARYADMFPAMEPRGLVKMRRESTFLWYSASVEALQDLLGFLYAECCTRNKAVEPHAIVQICK
jgi:hypothetical protein